MTVTTARSAIRISERGSRFHEWQGSPNGDESMPAPPTEPSRNGEPAHTWTTISAPEPRARRSRKQEPAAPTSLLLQFVRDVTGTVSPSHQRTPDLLIDGGIVGLFEQTLPGSWGRFCVLTHYADRRLHVVTAKKDTLMRKMGLRSYEGLDATIRLFQYGNRKTGFPGVLLRGDPIRFSSAGLKKLVLFAAANVAKDDERKTKLSQTRARTGRDGGLRSGAVRRSKSRLKQNNR